MAVDFVALGNYKEAASLFRRLIEVCQQQSPADPHQHAQALMGLGMTIRKQGELLKARKLLEQALQLRIEASGEWNVYTAATLHNLSLIAGDLGDTKRRLALQQRALRIRDRVWGPEHQNTANGLHTLGLTYVFMNNPSAAREVLRRSLDMRRKTLGDDHRDVGQSLPALALTYLPDAPRRAVELALEGEAITSNWLQASLRALSEREALLAASARWGGLNIALDALRVKPPSPTLSRLVLDAVIRNRSLVLDELMWRRSLPDQERLFKTRAAYSHRLLGGKGSLTASAYTGELERLRGLVEEAERELAARNRPFWEARRQSLAGWDEVRRALPEASALISFVRYKDDGANSLEFNYGVFLTRPGNDGIHFIDLGHAAEIEMLISTWRNHISAEAVSGGRSSRLIEQHTRASGAALRRRIWDPLTPLLKQVTTVFAVLDAPLHLVHLSALPIGKSRYLMETGPLIHYLNTERDLLRSSVERVGAGSLLAIGNPAFEMIPATATAALRGPAEACYDPAQTRFASLPSAALEARQVLETWRQAGGEGTLIERGQATHPILRELVPGRRIIHFATHGFFYHSRCGQAPGSVSPLLLSGLALAGANRGPDGLLTGDKVVQLNLEETDWAVLSGCDTGLGDIHAGEGVTGLRRAFQLAGVRTVIMSLWPVEDASARSWMLALYWNRAVRKLSTAEAVRAASLSLLRSARARNKSTHPIHWAPFLAAGDWR